MRNWRGWVSSTRFGGTGCSSCAARRGSARDRSSWIWDAVPDSRRSISPSWPAVPGRSSPSISRCASWRRLRAAASARGLRNIETRQVNLDAWELPVSDVDGVWCRWVAAFVADPEALVEKVRHALKPGGVFAVQEYVHYATWRLSPRSPAFEEFVRLVIDAWRKSGGEPDIGLDLPRLLERHGFARRARAAHRRDADAGDARLAVAEGVRRDRPAAAGEPRDDSQAAADATWASFLDAEARPADAHGDAADRADSGAADQLTEISQHDGHEDTKVDEGHEGLGPWALKSPSPRNLRVEFCANIPGAFVSSNRIVSKMTL